MYPLYFSAVLKSAEGKPLEYGEACLSETGCSIDFISEFVPLFKLGSPVCIARISGTEEFEQLPGSVYLSSRKKLQITGVPPKAYDAVRTLFEVNENSSVSLALVEGEPTHFNPQKARHINANLRYLSDSAVKLTAMEFIPEGQEICFSVETPAISLTDFFVRVERRIPLQRNAALLLCRPIAPGKANRRSIAAFLERLNPGPRLL